jgi:hypothetical protein
MPVPGSPRFTAAQLRVGANTPRAYIDKSRGKGTSTFPLPDAAACAGARPRQARVGTIARNQVLHIGNHFCILLLRHKIEYNYEYDFYTPTQ